MKIALDAMGGDNAPGETIRGAIEATQSFGVRIALVGRQDVLETELARYKHVPTQIEVVHAADVVTMTDAPASAARRKKDSSMLVAMNMVARGDADAVVSAGNSGAFMAAALFSFGRIEGIDRPAIGGLFPTTHGRVLIMDIGANTDCRPSYLVQFAHMGATYFENVLHKTSPRIALLSNGEEDMKGSQLILETNRLLRSSGLNFIGNAEGKDIPSGFTDVLVTDGFTGNVVVKLSEGIAGMIMTILREEMTKSFLAKAMAVLLRSTFKRVKRRLDYAEYGGAMLFGVRGVAVIAHGRSNAKAIKNSILTAKQAVDADAVKALQRIGAVDFAAPSQLI